MYRRCRLLTFSGVAGVAGWAFINEPGGYFGGVTAAFLGFVLVPSVLLLLLFAPPAIGGMLIPCRLRMWWRQGMTHRPSIPVVLRRAVMAADRHRCVGCGSYWQLQLDHIRPWSCGGLSSLWNLAVLCGQCNRIKSNFWIWRSGSMTYRPFDGRGNQILAAAILRAERRMRWSPARWLRAAYAVASL